MMTVAEVSRLPDVPINGRLRPTGRSGACERFAAGIAWLANERDCYQSQQLGTPHGRICGQRESEAILASEGNARLRLILVSGKLAVKGRYPSREEVAQFGQEETTGGGIDVHRSRCGTGSHWSGDWFEL